MTVNVHKEGIWNVVNPVYGKANGVWEQPFEGWVRVNGTWERTYLIGGGGFEYPYPVANSVWLDGSTQYLTIDPAAGDDRQKFSISKWFKRGSLGVIQGLFSEYANADNFFRIRIEANDTLAVLNRNAGVTTDTVGTTQVFRDTAGWFHLLFVCDTTLDEETDRWQIYINGDRVVDFDPENYPVLNAGMRLGVGNPIYVGTYSSAANRFNGYASEVVYTPGVALAPEDFGVLSSGIWCPREINFKQYDIYYDNSSSDKSDDYLLQNCSLTYDVDHYVTADPTPNFQLINLMEVEMVAGRKHALYSRIKSDTYTGSIWMRVYDPDGGLHQLESGPVTPAYKWFIYSDYVPEKSGTHRIAIVSQMTGAESYDWDYFVLRQLSQYSVNGFYLEFKDANFGLDSSGLGNDFTPTNMDAENQSLDTPTENYAVLDQNNVCQWASNGITNGALRYLHNVSSDAMAGTTKSFTTGKWYAECKITASLTNATLGVGSVQKAITNVYTWPGVDTISWSIYANAGAYRSYHNNSPTLLGLAVAVGDIMQIAVDADAGKVWFGVNGVWYSGDPSAGTGENYSGLTGELMFMHHQNIGNYCELNFGQRGFAYTPPTDFLELKTSNLPEPTVMEPDAGFNAIARIGTGVQGDVVTSMATSWVWIKRRDSLIDHQLIDKVRNTGRVLESNNNDPQHINNETVNAFNTNGYSLGIANATNKLGNTYIDWIWKEGAPFGLDIIPYSGTGAVLTIPHGLGKQPYCIFIKQVDGAASNWVVYHEYQNANPEQYFMNLNLDAVPGAHTTIWNDTKPTDTGFTVGTAPAVNGLGLYYIAYVFAPVAGYSKFGTLLGNNNVDGPFVHLGFKPKYLMMKNIDVAGSWWIMDAGRNPYNPITSMLYADLSSAEWVGANLADCVSNGIKFRSNATGINPANNFVYMAFAEQPGKYANAR